RSLSRGRPVQRVGRPPDRDPGLRRPAGPPHRRFESPARPDRRGVGRAERRRQGHRARCVSRLADRRRRAHRRQAAEGAMTGRGSKGALLMTMTHRLMLGVAAVALAVAPAWASNDEAGTSAASFLTIGTGPAVLGMGGAALGRTGSL